MANEVARRCKDSLTQQMSVTLERLRPLGSGKGDA